MRLSKYIIIYILTGIFCLSVIALTVMTKPNDNKLINIQYSQLTTDARKQIDCLADNIYHEAGFESEEGKVAVALVTLNRVNNPKWPKTICSVVKQKINSICQFSWVCMNVTKGSTIYEEARQIAMYVYSNYEKINDITKGALYYHADYVHPGWKLHKTVVIGRHIFYRESKHYDVKTKFASERRQPESPFILSSDGRNFSWNRQTSN